MELREMELAGCCRFAVDWKNGGCSEWPVDDYQPILLKLNQAIEI